MISVEVLTPHGLCGGVNAAIAKALQLARDRKGSEPVYCLHELVHNEIVIDELKALGYRFVDRIADVPKGATVVFSAHGVSPSVRAEAAERGLTVVDTTCPFVAKVHAAARSYAKRGLPVALLGDADHVEVKGIRGEIEAAGGRVALPERGGKLGVVAQTTLNSDEVARQVAELKRTYDVVTSADVCRATKERQDAVRRFCAKAAEPRAVLVLGSKTSANSRRLADVAAACGVRAFLAGTMDEVAALDLSGIATLGVTSGASTPERFFDEAVRFLKNLPRHVAIIMDGNGRWATARGKRRGEGHLAGAKTLEKVLNWCGARGIGYLTVYAFSTENWKRPKEEVNGLMRLFVTMLKSKARDFVKNRVRFRMVGRRGDLPKSLLKEIVRLEEKTAGFERQFLVALSYGGRAEIVDAANAAIARGEPVTEETFKSFLYAPDVPDPDLVIRTSGEKRTSNFLLWETAYAEYHFTETLWPDFSEADLDAALADYAARHRRKGGL